MSELTNLEIKSKLAVIEGHTIEHVSVDAVFIFDRNLSDVTGVDEYIDYNPVNDDALCFQLMFKYDVNINRYFDTATIDSDYNDKPPIANVSFSTDDVSINKAICLAIIEAHKEQ